MLTIGTPQDDPVGGAVLVTSGVVTIPRRYRVRLLVTAEGSTWVRLAHMGSGGAVRTSVLLPVNGMLGPLEVYEAYFANLEYVQVDMRAGIDATGTVQATVELL